jgi:HAD superfamily hydrolase (TIGR01509 family)
MMRFLQGIIFDVGDVLYDATAWRRWLARRLGELGATVTYEDLVLTWESLLVDVYCGRAQYWERFNKLIGRFGVHSDIASELIEEARRCGKEVVREQRLFDGVARTLEALHERGIRLAALSDTEATGANVRGRLDEMGIGRYIDAVICSVDLGHAKPERYAYEAAASALSLQPNQCAFVGHDGDELEGARAAGMMALAFNSAHKDSVSADLYLRRFDQLLELFTSARAPTT